MKRGCVEAGANGSEGSKRDEVDGGEGREEN